MDAPLLNPVRTLPSAQDTNSQILVFDTHPNAESQAWLEAAYETLLAEAGEAAGHEMRFFWNREVGLVEETELYPSRFLVRTVVAVVNESQEVQGLAVAHGTITASLVRGPEGLYAQLAFSFPLARGWGKGRSEFVLTQAQSRCIEQYESAAVPLCDTMRAVEPSALPIWSFDDEWDASVKPLRMRLSRNLVNRLFSIEPSSRPVLAQPSTYAQHPQRVAASSQVAAQPMLRLVQSPELDLATI